MITLDMKSKKLIYEQIFEEIKKLIILGVLKPDEKLPSVRQLARNLTINPNTIQKAYKKLERQNYTYSVRGKGSFVMKSKDSKTDEKIKSLTEKAKKVIKELKYYGILKEDLIEIINSVYKEEKDD